MFCEHRFNKDRLFFNVSDLFVSSEHSANRDKCNDDVWKKESLTHLGNLRADSVFGLLDHTVHNVLHQIVDAIPELSIDVREYPTIGDRYWC